MHLHLHLAQTIRDFGPIYTTWLFSLERANGDIKDLSINFKQGLEYTYMRKYLELVHGEDFIDKHLQLLNIFNFPKKSRHKYNVAFLSINKMLVTCSILE
jgi:hypothetical protein